MAVRSTLTSVPASRGLPRRVGRLSRCRPAYLPLDPPASPDLWSRKFTRKFQANVGWRTEPVKGREGWLPLDESGAVAARPDLVEDTAQVRDITEVFRKFRDRAT